MSSMTNKIATRYETAEIGHQVDAPSNPNRCVLKSELAEFNCTLISNPSVSYADNQYIKYEDIVSKPTWVRPTSCTFTYMLKTKSANQHAEIKKDGNWIPLGTTISNRVNFTESYITSLQKCYIMHSGKYSYPNSITLYYSNSSNNPSSITTTWKETIHATSTTGNYASYFDNSLKIPSVSDIPQNFVYDGTSEAATIYVYIDMIF